MPAPNPATAPTPAAPEVQNLSPIQKLAALLVILGPEAAGNVLRGLEPREVEGISGEMARFPTIHRDLQAEILKEFSGVAARAGTSIRGGLDVTRSALEKAMGAFEANEVISRVAPTGTTVASIEDIAEMAPRQIHNLMRLEQPQTVALILSHIGPDKAAETLAFFANDQRDKILERLATLAPTPVEVVEKVVEVLLARRGASPTRGMQHSGGVKTAADLLNSMDKAQGRTLLGSIEERNPELGAAIRQKMFTFEHLIFLNTAMLQRILREVDLRELALALKSASDKLKTSLLSCISKRAAESVRDEIAMLGPVRLKDIEAAQLRIIDAVRRLEAEGAVDLSEVGREGQGEMV
jgi:flagellar motor switch protein FliG